MRRVEQGKGRKDRYPLLGPRLLAELRPYWQVYRPVQPWVFPQRHKAVPLDPSTAQKLYSAAKPRAGITKAGGIPALRPAFATHLRWKRARICPPSNACWATRVSRLRCPTCMWRAATPPPRAHPWTAYREPSRQRRKPCRCCRRPRQRQAQGPIRRDHLLRWLTSCGRMGRRFGLLITSLTSKRGCCGRSPRAARQLSAGMSKRARPVGRHSSAPTPVALATAPSAKAQPGPSG